MTNTTIASKRMLAKDSSVSTATITTIHAPSTSSKYLLLLKPNVNTLKTYAYTLPKTWSPKDKSQFLELSNSNLRLSYKGPGKSDMDASCIRANNSIPYGCGIFYYEVDIISKGRDGYISIGFCGQHVSLSRLPGWDDVSWGYHGDDGNSFACSGTGKPYGPTFTTGDTVGCIINLAEMSASFTKNGLLLGTAFKDFHKDIKDKKQSLPSIYPAVGLRTPGEIIQVNFGDRLFKFDIESYIKEQKMAFWDKNIAFKSDSDETNPMINTKSMHGLIISHLLHSGYKETAMEFYNVTKSTDSSPFDSLSGADTIVERMEIRALMMKGNLDQVLKLCREKFSFVFKDSPHLHFSLCAQKFIEMIRSHSNSMNIDEESSDGLLKVIDYGRFIQQEFSSQLNNPDVNEALTEVFSLLCYEDPHKCAVSFLLDENNLTSLANFLNSGILARSHVPSDSPLEKIFRQGVVAHQTLLESNTGCAAFFSMDDCLM